MHAARVGSRVRGNDGGVAATTPPFRPECRSPRGEVPLRAPLIRSLHPAGKLALLHPIPARLAPVS
jgi:hypothetical protein